MAQKDIGNLRTRLSWEDNGNKQGLEGFRRDLKGLRSEMSVAKSAGKDYTNSLKGMQQQSDILSRRFKTQEERVKELRKRYDESVKVKGADANATRDLQAQLNNATAEMNRTEGQLQRLNDEIRRMQSPWTKLGDGMTKTGEVFQTVGRGMTDFGKDYTMKVTAPIVAGGVAVFKAASDFESAFAGVAKTFSGTDEQLADLRTGIREMAKELPASTTEIAAVAEAAGQLGIKTENIESFTRTMIDLGEATNMTSEVAATEFARFANIVGMSQDDFDKMGSSIVALGNSMATTEAEISSMAMRLAAQGSQVGMTEAQILALSATMSSLGIEAEAGGTAMTTVLKKIDKAVGEGGEAVAGFAKAAGVSSKEFSDAWKNDPITALDMFIKGLSASGDEGKNLTTILSDLGIKGIRESDTILRMAGASDLLTDAVKTSSGAWKENSALTDEAAQRYATTESQLKMLWNRVKDMAITLGEALIPAVMDALDAAEPLIKKIEEGVQAFRDMTEEEQQTILKTIALVAAVGPASVVLGNMTTAIGGVLKVGGSLASMLGKTGGAGLIGRIGLMGMGGPVGLAVGGVALLAGGIYALSKASEDNLEKTVESINKREEEINALDNTIAKYEELQKKNSLSTDEVLRYMDIMDELKNAESEEAIKKLSDEQAVLLEKSGLTNEEMEEFLGLNDQIVEKSPSTVQAISDQGNAYAETTDKIKELSRTERERLTQDTYMALTREMDNQKQNLETQKTLQEEIKGLEGERESENKKLLDYGTQIQTIDQTIAGLKNDLVGATQEERVEIEGKLRQEEAARSILEGQLEIQDGVIGKIDKQIDKKKNSLKETDKELELFDDLLADYAQMILLEQGIVSEKGKANEALDAQQKKIDDARKELEEFGKVNGKQSFEYKEQNEKLNEQQRKIDVAKGKLEEMNEVAGRTVYKDVNVKTNVDKTYTTLSETIGKHVRVYTSTDGQYARIGDPVTKQVNIRTAGGRVLEQYASGTSNHPGGAFIAGEEGFELGRLGNRWEMLNLGLYDRPSGYQVFTHDESKKILGALNRMPGYASGVSPSGEANRIVKSLNDQSPNQNVVVNIQPAPVYFDGYEFTQIQFEHIDTIQKSNFTKELNLNGVK